MMVHIFCPASGRCPTGSLQDNAHICRAQEQYLFIWGLRTRDDKKLINVGDGCRGIFRGRSVIKGC